MEQSRSLLCLSQHSLGVGKSRLLSSGTILLLARKLSPVRGEVERSSHVEPGSILRLFSVI